MWFKPFHSQIGPTKEIYSIFFTSVSRCTKILSRIIFRWTIVRVIPTFLPVDEFLVSLNITICVSQFQQVYSFVCHTGKYLQSVETSSRVKKLRRYRIPVLAVPLLTNHRTKSNRSLTRLFQYRQLFGYQNTRSIQYRYPGASHEPSFSAFEISIGGSCRSNIGPLEGTRQSFYRFDSHHTYSTPFMCHFFAKRLARDFPVVGWYRFEWKVTDDTQDRKSTRLNSSHVD